MISIASRDPFSLDSYKYRKFRRRRGKYRSFLPSRKLPARRLTRCALDTTNETHMRQNSSLELAAHSFGPFTVGRACLVGVGEKIFFSLSPNQFDSNRRSRWGRATRPTTRRTRVCAGASSHRHCSVEDRVARSGIMSGVANVGARVEEMRLVRANRPLRC